MNLKWTTQYQIPDQTFFYINPQNTPWHFCVTYAYFRPGGTYILTERDRPLFGY